jgi:hypothetical protein
MIASSLPLSLPACPFDGLKDFLSMVQEAEVFRAIPKNANYLII